jgi:antibiotic biosynthesis monooxygenase (ABM) superfamily enzyme
MAMALWFDPVATRIRVLEKLIADSSEELSAIRSMVEGMSETESLRQQLAERTLQHQTQLDNAVRLTGENEALQQQLAEARALLREAMEFVDPNYYEAWFKRAAEAGGDR